MATIIPVSTCANFGEDFVAASPAGTAADLTGMSFVNDGDTLLVVSSTTSSHPYTINGVATDDSNRPLAELHTLTGGEYQVLGPFATGKYNQANGTVTLTMAASTAGVAFRAFKLGKG